MVRNLLTLNEGKWRIAPIESSRFMDMLMNDLATQIAESQTRVGFISSLNPGMQGAHSVVSEIATTDIPILLFGESGTGKDAYASFIHRVSGLGAPLRKLSCATASPESLLRDIRDCLKPAGSRNEAGTIFLDGIDELDLAGQRVLLSLLSDGEARNGGGKLSARLISSTSQDLENSIAAGQFRRELYFRINGFCLRLPSLRDRREDIQPLLEHLLIRHSEELRRETPKIDAKAIELMGGYDWPGNIRELENVAKKAVVLGSLNAAFNDLRCKPQLAASRSKENGLSSLKLASRAASRRTEHEMILKALKRTRWNRKRAAQELQISYKSLLYKIKQIGVQESGLE